MLVIYETMYLNTAISLVMGAGGIFPFSLLRIDRMAV